jgi:hypothetical protein
MPENPKSADTKNQSLEKGTYEIIRSRLQKHQNELRKRLDLLDQSHKEVFKSVEIKLIANHRTIPGQIA